MFKSTHVTTFSYKYSANGCAVNLQVSLDMLLKLKVVILREDLSELESVASENRHLHWLLVGCGPQKPYM